MLVLNRNIGERIVLPESGVNITVLGVHGKRVQIGIEAPRSTTVLRAEIWQRIMDAEKSLPGDALLSEPTCGCSTL